MTISWDWPPRPTLTFEEDLPTNVSDHFASEDLADDQDYAAFLVFVWIGALLYCGFFFLGAWKLAELIVG